MSLGIGDHRALLDLHHFTQSLMQTRKANMTPEERINEWFVYHAPDAGQMAAYGALRAKAKELALLIVAQTPAGADQTAALRKLRECIMTANAAIACKGA